MVVQDNLTYDDNPMQVSLEPTSRGTVVQKKSCGGLETIIESQNSSYQSPSKLVINRNEIVANSICVAELVDEEDEPSGSDILPLDAISSACENQFDQSKIRVSGSSEKQVKQEQSLRGSETRKQRSRADKENVNISLEKKTLAANLVSSNAESNENTAREFGRESLVHSQQDNTLGEGGGESGKKE